MKNMFRFIDIFHTVLELTSSAWSDGWFWRALTFVPKFAKYAWALEGIQNLGWVWRTETDPVEKVYALGALRIAVQEAAEIAKTL